MNIRKNRVCLSRGAVRSSCGICGCWRKPYSLIPGISSGSARRNLDTGTSAANTKLLRSPFPVVCRVLGYFQCVGWSFCGMRVRLIRPCWSAAHPRHSRAVSKTTPELQLEMRFNDFTRELQVSTVLSFQMFHYIAKEYPPYAGSST